MEPLTRYFLVYKDTNIYEGDSWNAYSFATEGERNRMIHDLQSATSAWSESAVPFFTFERDMTDLAALYLPTEDNDEEVV
jgi:hypothetical protein